MKIEWNRVTRFSKTLAGILFIVLPILGFWLGMEYQELKYRAKGVFIENIKPGYNVVDYKNPPYVEPNFEGEADPARMTLGMKTWIWDKNKAFTLTFNSDGRVAIGTDCNSMGGSYSTDGNKISISQIESTLMYCEGSREGEFASLLQEAQEYRFTSKGELILNIKDGGEVVLR